MIREPTGKNPEAALLKTEPAITVPTLHEHQDIAVTDCKSLYDLVTRTAPPNCSEFRTQLVARAYQGCPQRKCHPPMGTLRCPVGRLFDQSNAVSLLERNPACWKLPIT